MTRYIPFTFMSLCCAAACTHTIENKQVNVDSIRVHYIVDTTKFAILPFDSTDCKDGKSGKLTPEDLSSIEAILNISVDRYNKNYKSREYTGHIDLAEYKRQYVPYIDKDEHLKVCVYCFCEGTFNNNSWKKYRVVVNDGGSCIFQVTIDLSTGQYSGFYTNGT